MLSVARVVENVVSAPRESVRTEEALGPTLIEMRYPVTSALFAALVTASSGAHAHIALDQPPKRDVAMKTRPCGGTGARTTPAVFAPGQKVTVMWHETVVHPGFFRVALSTDGTTFPADPTDPPPAVAPPVLAIIPKVDGVTSYSSDITLPETPCETCTIQVIQYMRQHTPPPYYYQCADIAIRPGGAGGASGGAAGTMNTGGAMNTGGVAGAGGMPVTGAGGMPGNGSGGVFGGSAGGAPYVGGATGSAGSAGAGPDAGTVGAATDSSSCSFAPRSTRSSPVFLLSALAAAKALRSLRRRR